MLPFSHVLERSFDKFSNNTEVDRVCTSGSPFIDV